jgi:ABC-2 type transport system permease protein
MLRISRYLRLWLALARFSLVRELAFRTNFLVKIVVEMLWLGILIAFYETIFAKTNSVADWDRYQYLFFLGFYFALGGLLETLFLENCNNFADLVRTGDLDFYLLKPMDEQFLVSCRTIDWSCLPNVLMGAGVMLAALFFGGWEFDLGRLALFSITLFCGTALAYGFLLLLTSASVWFMRNQSLFEMWWLFTTLMRYPREIFRGSWAAPVGWFFSFAIPIMLVTNVPARIMMRAVEPNMVAYITAATLVVLWASRRFFRFALERYRSASS